MRERNLTRESKTSNRRRPLFSSVQPRWELLAPGAALCGYGWFFSDDLGWLAYGVIGLGVFVATVGAKAYEWSQEHLEHWIERWEAQPPAIAKELALTKAWRHFWLSLGAMFALGAFSLWRVRMTVGRPVAERFYIFSADTWLGRLEHSWFNDALYAFGMVGILYVLYTLKEFLGGRSDHSVDSLLGSTDSKLAEERWVDHQQRSKLMIGTGIVIILVWAWLEEIADLVPGYVFDKWDINAIYIGFIVGYSMMHHLPYPVFSARPPFRLGVRSRAVWLADGIRLLYAAFVWAYTSLMEPSTYGERWAHIAELSAIILGSMWLLDVRRRASRPPVALGLNKAPVEPESKL
jgi:hypothetical protein